MIEMHVSEIGFCSGHSASGVYVDDYARTTVRGLYAAGDMASVPHNYMLGAFANGAFAGEDAVAFARDVDFADYDAGAIVAEQKRVLAPTRRDDGLPPNEIEYKTRRLVNDYLQPPKVSRKMELGRNRFGEVREDIETALYVRDSHELMRALEVQSIIDCADMAAAASLYRTESRWGLYHNRVEYPGRDDANWFCHSILSKGRDGKPTLAKKPVAPYLIPIGENERDAYYRQRIVASEAAE
jgi:succinate dehydrogenase/fumarate reductase flavoprotein subunit